MAVQGKKKKTALPTITVSSEATSGSCRSDGAGDEERPSVAAQKHGRGASVTLSTLQGSTNDSTARSIPTNYHDTSMSEEASQLLDNSNLSQFQVHPGRRLSQQSQFIALHPPPKTQSRVQKELPHSPNNQTTAYQDKDLPQLPLLQFNEDNIWPALFKPATTAKSDANATEFPNGDSTTCAPPIARQSSQKRKSIVMLQQDIPRKSSRRGTPKERRESKNARRLSRAQNPAKKFTISSPIPLANSESDQSGVGHAGITFSTPILSAAAGKEHIRADENDASSPLVSLASGNINPVQTPSGDDYKKKHHNMLDMTVMLKGPQSKPKTSDGGASQGVEPPKKKFVGNRLLNKVRMAFTGRSSSKKEHDSIRDDALLNDSFLPDDEEAPPLTSSMESRVNEGLNLNKPKVRAMTGHGRIARKPLPDDGKSLRSKQSCDDPSVPDRSYSNSDEISDNLDKYPPLIPQVASKSASTLPPVPTLPAISLQSPYVLPRTPISGPILSLHSDFDDFLSSSPDATSTPAQHRWKLAPSVKQDGSRGPLMTVSASTPSLFDRDETFSGISTSPTFTRETKSEPTASTAAPRSNMERSSAFSGSSGGLSPEDPVKKKKNPSPSRSALEEMGGQMREMYRPLPNPLPRHQFPAPTALAAKDTNSADGRLNTPRSEPTVPQPVHKKDTAKQHMRRAPIIPSPGTGEMYLRRARYGRYGPHSHPGLMDTSLDEPQWNNRAAYNVGAMRRT